MMFDFIGVILCYWDEEGVYEGGVVVVCCLRGMEEGFWKILILDIYDEIDVVMCEWVIIDENGNFYMDIVEVFVEVFGVNFEVWFEVGEFNSDQECFFWVIKEQIKVNVGILVSFDDFCFDMLLFLMIGGYQCVWQIFGGDVGFVEVIVFMNEVVFGEVLLE